MNHSKEVEAAHNGEIQSAFERAVRLAIQEGNFWRSFMEVPPIVIDTAEIARAWKASRKPILSILRSKLTSPLEKMSLTPDILTAVAAYDIQRKAIADASQSLLGVVSRNVQNLP